MKTLKQIKQEMRYGDILTTKEFLETVNSGCFLPYDGTGHPHNGKKELKDISVWELDESELKQYPYVCWYNR